MEKVVAVLDRKLFAAALNTMFPRAQRTYPEDSLRTIPLERHPFRLPIPAIRGSDKKRDVYLVGVLRVTQPSVESMSQIVGSRVTDYAHSDTSDDWGYMRIIRGEVGLWIPAPGEKSWQKYDYYFEFGWGHSVFISGGCNNHTGEAGAGGKKMLNLFSVASSLLGVTLHDVVMPYPMFEEGEDWLHAEYNTFLDSGRDSEKD